MSLSFEYDANILYRIRQELPEGMMHEVSLCHSLLQGKSSEVSSSFGLPPEVLTGRGLELSTRLSRSDLILDGEKRRKPKRTQVMSKVEIERYPSVVENFFYTESDTATIQTIFADTFSVSVDEGKRRKYPSAGGLYFNQLFLTQPLIHTDKIEVLHWLPHADQFEVLSHIPVDMFTRCTHLSSEFWGNGHSMIIHAVVPELLVIKYGGMGYHFAIQEIGHASSRLNLVSRNFGYNSMPYGYVDKLSLQSALGLNPSSIWFEACDILGKWI
ncbi:hypothetical protein GSS88_03915 [Corynebacterium sp. 3HC-13]|uniref:hypothetical protein n=1 Tax=Corynebacterium poyangense TaxID=2684405 RepID=UPI001CCB0063|nr:hypothetical protein [Corynebacterium poyangense]MBZ8176946.1 hypothetical protein [Corynebacterium poyangense]